MDKSKHAEAAARAHSNLNTWGAIVAILEGGVFYGSNTHSAQQRVIKIAQAEMQKHLREFDAAMAKVAKL